MRLDSGGGEDVPEDANDRHLQKKERPGTPGIQPCHRVTVQCDNGPVILTAALEREIIRFTQVDYRVSWRMGGVAEQTVSGDCMHINSRYSIFICAIFVLTSVISCQRAAAQTQDYVAKFNSGGTVVNSSIFDNGFVGIGTTTPSRALDVNGDIHLSGGGWGFRLNPVAGELRLRNDQDSAQLQFHASALIGDLGLGIGTSALRAAADIVASNATLNLDNNVGNSGTVGIQLLHVNGSGNQQKVAIFSDALGSWGKGNLRFALNTGNDTSNVSLADTRVFIDGSSGNVGIGTTTPGQMLEVNGSLRLSPGSGGRLYFPDGSSLSSTSGLGTITGVLPSSGLTGGGYSGYVTLGVDSTVARLNQSQTFSGIQTFNSAAVANGTLIYNNLGGDVLQGICLNIGYCMRFTQTGDFHVSGTYYQHGQDYAESVPASGNRSDYGPGDVIAVDSDTPNHFTKATEPYSTLVAGVYSTAPGILASSHPMADGTDTEFSKELPLAMIGIVPCKVVDENGPIKPGDLLVASSLPGFAMKGSDRTRLTGAVIGKALDSLASGKGAIRILLALQ
jgi:hypothetical protein